MKRSDIHEKSLKDFNLAQSALRDERKQSLEDRRFYSIAGAQWEDLREQFENKPKFEFNKIHLSVIRIIDEYRNNRIGVDFMPKDGNSDRKLADTLDSLYRSDEQDSCAEEAYDNAFEEAVGGGFGAWRITTEYEDEYDEDNEYQRIKFEPIYDADSCVYFNAGAKKQDKSDAKQCWILHAMPIEDYIEEFNDDPNSWPKSVHRHEFDWYNAHMVYVAEYYIKEEYKKNVYIYETLDGNEEKYSDSDFENDSELSDKLSMTGTVFVRQRKVKSVRVHKYLMSGNAILDDMGYIAGKCIPVIPVYGKRWYVDSKERCMGHVRLAKDAQRLKNMQVSKLAETASLSSTEKPIFFPQQIAGHQPRWEQDNVKNWPFLTINPIKDLDGNIQAIGPVAYTKPPTIPQALAALLQTSEEDIQDLLGNQQNAEQVQPNTSGLAVELVQNRLDRQTSIYISNMAKAIRRSGQVWLEIAKEIYVESKRKMRGLNKDYESVQVELMTPTANPETLGIEYENDITKANHEVFVNVGPSSHTKRQATVRSLTDMMRISINDQETMTVLTSMAIMNMEGEGIDDVRQYFRKKLVMMGAIEPNEDEKKMLEEAKQKAQQPSPEQQYMEAAALEAMAKTEKTRADALLSAARTEETKAKTLETLSEIDDSERKNTIETLRSLSEVQQKQEDQRQNMIKLQQEFNQRGSSNGNGS